MKQYGFILIACASALYCPAVAQDTTANVAVQASRTDTGVTLTRKEARAKALAQVDNAKDGEEKEKAYQEMMSQYPPKSPNKPNEVYNYARQGVAMGYIRQNNLPKAIAFVNMMDPGVFKISVQYQIAGSLMARKDFADAEQMLKDGIASAEALLPQGDEGESKGARMAYAHCCNSYADLLYRQNNYELALKYIQLAEVNTTVQPANHNGLYAEILVALGKDQEAFDIIDKSLKAGKVTVSMRKELETIYPKLKGKDGYDAYMAEVDGQLNARTKQQRAARMLDEPAPAFTLKDVDGHDVSLADFKGKVVVVDFWATWCGPCKASFPVMQAAINKYKDSNNVVFLFIHTWERGEGNPTREARRYVKDNKYSFEVLMDLKDWSTGVNPVVKSFNVTGIPTKFIIDRNGRIRFRVTGFNRNSNETEMVEELSDMIQLAKNP